jgi:leucyl-tRNA synthetase
MLAPFVPHIAEELWQRLGHATPLSETAWPEYDRAAVVEEELQVVVQVNGKLRSKITVAPGTDDETVKSCALADEKVQPFIADKQVRKVICVPGKLVNIVVG